jgi:hypothetical protein
LSKSIPLLKISIPKNFDTNELILRLELISDANGGRDDEIQLNDPNTVLNSVMKSSVTHLQNP